MRLMLNSRRWAVGFLLIASTAATGCSNRLPGEVSGTIKLHGQAPKLAGLEIVFQSESGELVSAVIAEDGTYAAPSVPAGAIKIYFSSVSEEAAKEGINTLAGNGRLKRPTGAPKAAPAARATGPYPKSNPIREDLREASTSKIEITVVPGKPMQFDYDLP